MKVGAKQVASPSLLVAGPYRANGGRKEAGRRKPWKPPPGRVFDSLTAAAPNLFASATRFAYTLSQAGRYGLAIYDVQGREVAILANGTRWAGSYSEQWDGTLMRVRTGLSSGV